LKTDIPEEFIDGIYSYSLNIVLLKLSKPEYTSEQRMVNTFKPVLYPLYKSFMDGLIESPDIFWDKGEDGDEWPDHQKTDRLFYGSAISTRNTKHLLNDPVDAIEIVNLKLKSYKKIC